MAIGEGQYLGNHRRQQSLVFVASLLGLLMAIAPRQERALFITDGQGLKAFAAAFPPINPATLLSFPYAYSPRTGPLAAFFARTPRPGAAPALTPAGPAGAATPFAPAPDAGQAAPFGSQSPVGGAPNGPFTPAQFGVPNLSPAVPSTSGNATPIPTATQTPVPVPAVPEPATWAMMVTGLGLAGALLRRRAARPGRPAAAR